MKLAILIASDGERWESRLLSAFEEPSAAVTVARRCVDVLELQSVAAAGLGRAALVSGSLRRFDRAAVDRIVAAGVVVVAVVTRDDHVAEQRLRAIGVAALVPSDADPAVVAAVLVEAARIGPPTPSAAQPRVAPGGLAEPVRRSAVATVGEPRDGVVIAVWGPAGAPGRSTVALALADEISRRDREVLLVDADVYGATIAAAVGMLDESAGLAGLCRLLNTEGLDQAMLASRCWRLRPGLRILTGSPIAARWPDLRPSALTAILGVARALVDVTVVDVGFCLENDEELSYDTAAPRRNGATLTILNDADLVVAVGSGDPIGLQRVARGIGDLLEAVGVGEPMLVLNRVQRSGPGRKPTDELSAVARRFTGLVPRAFLPYDRHWLDVALSSGRTLAEVRRSSPLRRAVAELAVQILDGIEH
jgi:Flp pilus assembly CpaE family ATPase